MLLLLVQEPHSEDHWARAQKTVRKMLRIESREVGRAL